MAIKGYMESTLGQSEIFKGINDIQGGENTVQKAKNLIKTAKILTNEDIEAAYISVKQITDTLTREAMKAFDNGRVVLVYNNVPALSVTQALPFITFKTSRGYITYVFMDKYISISRDGVMNLQAPILRDLLTGAVIANGLKNNYSALSTNQYLQNIMTEIYTKFFTRILNRQFSIAADKVVFDTIQYWINKFFLLRIFGASDSPENIESISNKHFKYIDEMKYEEIKKQYADTDPQTVSELLALVKTASPRMKSLNLGVFLSDWINYYYVPSMLAVDNIEYLIFMTVALLAGNNIISISASDIVKEAKNIKSLRGELLKLI
ncbi:MAG: hypothetical protein NC548_12785 [Lachnospiraceae bacterium]|nr:hypothetical protein [Lachnospiraceae bacterium]MCM1230734.1 hypothetical protein [Ruminococcus flavefaciens]